MGSRFQLSLLPWIVFAVAARAGAQGVGWAAVLALAAALVVQLRPGNAERVTALDAGGFAVFGLLAVAGAVLGASSLQLYGRALAFGGLTLISGVSLLLVPFVAPYMREFVSPGQETGARFRRANTAVATVWALAFAGITASYVIAAVLDNPWAATSFNWLLPGAIAVCANAKVTARWHDDFDPDRARDELARLGDLFSA